MPDLPKIFFIQFAPETWSALHKLRHFTGPPLPNNGYVRIGLRDCENHLDKVSVLWRVAEQLRPSLMLDREELDRLGATNNLHSQEFAAVCEAIVCALYSALDGLRVFIFGGYHGVKRVQNESNEKLLKRAKLNEYGPGFDEEIRTLLAEAYDSWFPPLRLLRTELIHGSTGSCHLDTGTNLIRYFNNGIKQEGRTYFKDDIEGLLRGFEGYVRKLVEDVARMHFARLIPELQFHMCGTYLGRWYGRMAAASPTVSSNDGHCLSYDWFEKEEGFFCPLAKQCPAYQRKWPDGSKAVSGGGSPQLQTS